MTSKVDLDYVSGKDEFKKNCEEATRFIESCFDENNEGDGLTFDERIESRVNELPASVKNIVMSASGKFEEDTSHDDELVDIEELEDECECDCKCEDEYMEYDCNGGELLPKDLLLFASETRGAYRTRKRELKQKQADLRLNTDWSKAIPDKDRISEKDKEAWITLATIELQSEVDDLETEAAYLSELWKLEKIMLKTS